jgi:hypothetical protein
VSSGTDITIRGCTFDGDVASNRNAEDDGYGFGIGFSASQCTNLVFEDNTIHTFLRGATFGRCDNTVVRGNDLHSIRMDGMNFVVPQGVLIEDNHLHDFRRSLVAGDHADMIQFWTTNATRPGTDITIRNNTLDIGAGDHTQSIFMRNEEVDWAGPAVEMFYRNVLIEGNTIYNDHPHGIAVGETAGLIIRNNAVLHADGATEGVTGTSSLPKISVAVASTDVTIVDNLTGGVTAAGGRATWTVANNLVVQDTDQSAPNHYHGSVSLWADGALNVDHTLSAALRTNSSSNLGFGNPWGGKNFEGDISAFEIRSHVGEYPDTPDHSAIIVLVPDNVNGTGMHDLGWSGHVFDLAASTTRLLDNAHVVTGPDGPVLHLDGSKDYASLRQEVEVETADRVGFSVDFKRDTVDGTDDRLIWNHMRLGLTLTRDGLAVDVATLDQGFRKYTAGNLGLNDADLHRIEVMVDSVANHLQVLLDGDIVIDATDADLDHVGTGLTQSGWTIGTGWNRYFDGEVHDFRLGDQFQFIDAYAGL